MTARDRARVPSRGLQPARRAAIRARSVSEGPFAAAPPSPWPSLARRALITLLALTAGVASAPADLPVVTVSADNTTIAESCRIVIPPNAIIADADNNGVIQIAAPDITIEFADGSVLRGSSLETRPDEYRGYGVRLNGHEDVTIRNARISGFWCGLWATDANGLILEHIDASDNRRAHLKSTPTAEDSGDWLYPHKNDDHEWLNNYGVAIYVEQSDGVTVRACQVHHGQNALILDRVNDAKIYDNDFSFNSGWGIALWRSSRNVITRNALDFCVRGYSHGVYNRGQDSAGVLMFEQCRHNFVAENSATHCGDGFFGFAGREALGEAGEHPPDWYKRRGNNNNVLRDNDFSYAPAHGIEMTFSFGNTFVGNRLVGNAICGVWGGYSQNTLIADNMLENNGEMAYGLERGGVNIEHGQRNRILHNMFRDNKCGVHLWWDPDEHFADNPWAKSNGVESSENLIAANTFHGDKLAYHFRGKSDVTIGPNELDDVERESDADADVNVHHRPNLTVESIKTPEYPIFGETRPIGARKHLYGRENIIMTEWGPWDHESPLVRVVEDTGGSITYELRKMPETPRVTIKGPGVRRSSLEQAQADEVVTFTVSAEEPGVHPYEALIEAGDFRQVVQGTLISTTWSATFFKWTEDNDPRENLAGWRMLATTPDAITIETSRLQLKYGGGGPSETKLSTELTKAKLGGDYFGMIARTHLPLPAGKWKFTTLSDDGVRVTINGASRPIIENWTWHGPTRNTDVFELTSPKTVEITVEHFEIDGYAVLEVNIARSDSRGMRWK